MNFTLVTLPPSHVCQRKMILTCSICDSIRIYYPTPFRKNESLTHAHSGPYKRHFHDDRKRIFSLFSIYFFSSCVSTPSSHMLSNPLSAEYLTSGSYSRIRCISSENSRAVRIYQVSPRFLLYPFSPPPSLTIDLIRNGGTFRIVFSSIISNTSYERHNELPLFFTFFFDSLMQPSNIFFACIFRCLFFWPLLASF